MMQLNSPTNMGKEHATSQDVIDGCNGVSWATDQFLDANGVDDLVMHSQSVIDALKHLLLNSKGLSRVVDDPPMRLQLLEGSRSVGSALAALLEASRSLNPDKQAKQEAAAVVKAKTAAVLETVKEIEKVCLTERSS